MGVYRAKECVLRTQFFGDRWEVVVERGKQPPFRFFLSEDALSSLMRGGEASDSRFAIRRDASSVSIRQTSSDAEIAEIPWRSFLTLV